MFKTCTVSLDRRPTRRIRLDNDRQARRRLPARHPVANVHSAVHGSVTHVLCEQLADGAGTKSHSAEPRYERNVEAGRRALEWIMWIDRDAIVLDAAARSPLSYHPRPRNSRRSTSSQPRRLRPQRRRLHVPRLDVVSRALQHNPLLPLLPPGRTLVLAEQTAMEKITREDKWKDSVVRVPWYWFNAYPDERTAWRITATTSSRQIWNGSAHDAATLSCILRATRAQWAHAKWLDMLAEIGKSGGRKCCEGYLGRDRGVLGQLGE